MSVSRRHFLKTLAAATSYLLSGCREGEHNPEGERADPNYRSGRSSPVEDITFLLLPPYRAEGEGRLRLLNPDEPNLIEYFAHYMSQFPEGIDTSKLKKGAFNIQPYNVLTETEAGPVWSADPNSNEVVVNGYEDIVADFAENRQAFVKQNNLHQQEWPENRTLEEKKAAFIKYGDQLRSQLRCRAPDPCSVEADPLRLAYDNRAVSPSSFYTIMSVWAKTFMDLDAQYVTGELLIGGKLQPLDGLLIQDSPVYTPGIRGADKLQQQLYDRIQEMRKERKSQ